MSSIVKNLTRIRQYGKIYYYFDAPNHRDDWRPIGYAHGRKWRIVDSWPSGLGDSMITYKCVPMEVKRVGQWEYEKND